MGVAIVTKSELIEEIAQRTGLTKSRAEMVVGTVFDSMVDAMARGEGIEIRGFGSFTVRQYKAYEGRNPRTGAAVHVAPKKLPFFKVGKELRERVNNDRADAASSPKESQAPSVTASTTERAPRLERLRDDSVSEDVI